MARTTCCRSPLARIDSGAGGPARGETAATDGWQRKAPSGAAQGGEAHNRTDRIDDDPVESPDAALTSLGFMRRRGWPGIDPPIQALDYSLRSLSGGHPLRFRHMPGPHWFTLGKK